MVKNFYTIWYGLETGVFEGWNKCKKHVLGVSGSKYRGFNTEEEATTAFELGYDRYNYGDPPDDQPEPPDKPDDPADDPLSGQPLPPEDDLPF
jgi:hypothetical protein